MRLGERLADQTALLELRLHEVAVHQRDEVDRDLFGARRFALAVVRARTEVRLHRLDHADRAVPALGLTLRQQVQMLQLRGGEQLSGTVRTCGNARTARD